MEKMDRATEARILSSIEKAIRLTKEGTDSSEALLKVATEERLHPEIVKRMAEAMNISRTRAHMQSSPAEKRAESFPLVDAAWVIDRMYPPEVAVPVQEKAAGWIPPEYGRPEVQNFFELTLFSTNNVLVKAAEAKEAPVSEFRKAKLMDKRAGLQKLKRVSESDLRIANTELLKQAQAAAFQFRDVYKFDFPEIERRVFAKYGESGRKVMDMLYGLGGLGRFKVKRAQLGQRETLVWDGRKEPYSWVDDLFLRANKLQLLAKESVDREYELAEFNAKHGFRQEWEAERPPGILDDIIDPPPFQFKEGGQFVDPALLARGITREETMGRGARTVPGQAATQAIKDQAANPTLSSVATRQGVLRKGSVPGLAGQPAPPAQPAPAAPVRPPVAAVKGADLRPFAKRAADPWSTGMVMGSLAMGLREPPELSKYREVLADVYDPVHEARMESVKSKAMLNDFLSNDPILSSYDPETVTGVYNQIASMAPNAARQPALMRGLLRKAIQQGGVIEPFEVQQLTQMERAFKGEMKPQESPLYTEGR